MWDGRGCHKVIDEAVGQTEHKRLLFLRQSTRPQRSTPRACGQTLDQRKFARRVKALTAYGSSEDLTIRENNVHSVRNGGEVRRMGT